MQNYLMKSYRFRIYPSKQQEAMLVEHLRISKDVWNSLLAASMKKGGSAPF